MILLIDNYDSFTYNLYQFIGEMYDDIKVVRNDEITIDEIETISPEALIISPGPGYPVNSGICVNAIKHFSGKIPILGICLGHQAIAEAFGGQVIKAKELMHGKASKIKIDNSSPLFKDLPAAVLSARYHSLIVNLDNLPNCFSITASDSCGQIMAIEQREHKTFGLQFHPESVLSEHGKLIFKNFLSLIPGIKFNKEVEIINDNLPKTALKSYISKVTDGEDLSLEESIKAVNIIMSGEATDSQIAGFLTALRIKGETVAEITGFAKTMREKAKTIYGCSDAIDIVGTGGDLSNTFNISTTASFVIAGCGVKVAKHGNRSVSSKSGAADVLESLGVKITSSPQQSEDMINNIGISFLFAQSYHTSMKFVGPARRDLGIRTIFNILGPLANPANTNYIVLGVYDKKLLEPMGKVLINLGIKRAMLIYGNDQLDEISVSSTTSVCEINNNKLNFYEINPVEYNFPVYNKSEITGGTADKNAEITLGILNGTVLGAKRDIVIINAACALYISGVAISIKEGINLANESIDSKKALNKLNELIYASNNN